MSKITVTGSLGNIGSYLVTDLVALGHEVTVVSSRQERTAAIEAAGAKAAIAAIDDVVALSKAFADADAVFAMTPPNLGGSNVVENTIDAGRAIAKAIELSGVRRVVMLSSIGADHASGTGPIVALHHIETLYRQLPEVEFTFLRAGYFYTNFYNDIPMIQQAGIIGANYPDNVALPLVHPKDIATAAVRELQQEKTGKDIVYIVSDVLTPLEYTTILAEAIGRDALPWVVFPDEQSLSGMQQAGMPESLAQLYTEMGQGIRTHKLMDHFEATGAPVSGATKFREFAKEWALKYAEIK